MNFNRILMTSSLVLSALCMGAQTSEDVIEYDEHDVFDPHWYVQGQIGAQETLGEKGFSNLLSPNAQLGVGYNFNPYIGARFNLNMWQSKGVLEVPAYNIEGKWKWNYVAPALNVTLDLTNLIWGYEANRKWQFGAFGGVGVNIGFNNDEANEFRAQLTQTNPNIKTAMRGLWDGTKLRLTGQFGLYVDYNVNEKLAVGFELQANTLSDSYNSKLAENADWYFNALVGVKYTLGKKSHKVHKELKVPTRTITVYDTVYVDRVVEKVVEKVVNTPVATPAPTEKKVERLHRDIFFTLSNTVVSNEEMPKVAEIASFMKSHPNSKVSIMGYADKGTGTKEINLRLSKRRANAVVKALVENFNINRSRIVVQSMDENMEQPYPDPLKNRVAICVAE